MFDSSVFFLLSCSAGTSSLLSRLIDAGGLVGKGGRFGGAGRGAQGLGGGTVTKGGGAGRGALGKLYGGFWGGAMGGLGGSLGNLRGGGLIGVSLIVEGGIVGVLTTGGVLRTTGGIGSFDANERLGARMGARNGSGREG